jgi:excisionase family DNA binding protein
VTFTQISRRDKGMTALSDRPIAVSVGRAAVLVGVSKATIRSFAKTGRLRVARMGRRVVVPMNSLEQLVRDSITPQYDDREATRT